MYVARANRAGVAHARSGAVVVAGLACAVLTAAALAWLLGLASRGLELTDEGYYLAWLADPRRFDASASQFGFVYHGLYQLLDGNVVALRRVNLLGTWALAWWMFCVLLARRDEPSAPAGVRLLFATTCAGLATSALIVFWTWLVTPSYN